MSLLKQPSKEFLQIDVLAKLSKSLKNACEGVQLLVKMQALG